eukprot:252303-Pyramimonas_sp.AAC.1
MERPAHQRADALRRARNIALLRQLDAAVNVRALEVHCVVRDAVGDEGVELAPRFAEELGLVRFFASASIDPA